MASRTEETAAACSRGDQLGAQVPSRQGPAEGGSGAGSGDASYTTIARSGTAGEGLDTPDRTPIMDAPAAAETNRAAPSTPSRFVREGSRTGTPRPYRARKELAMTAGSPPSPTHHSSRAHSRI